MGDRLPDHERTCCADVDGIEVPQLFGERCRSEGPVTANVNAPQKYHKCHACFLDALKEPIIWANREMKHRYRLPNVRLQARAAGGASLLEAAVRTRPSC